MKNILFEGIYPATYALYDKNLNAKKDSLAKLIAHNEKHGVRGFYVGGNTGECTVLPNRTRKQILEAIKESAKPTSKLIAHVGAGHLDDVEDLIDHANGVGVDAIASLPPSLTDYYSANEIVAYYKHIASLTKLPILAYVTDLNCDLVWFGKQIMEIDNVIGLKVSIANYYAFEQLKTINDGNINILNGPDQSMLAGLVMGADGAIGTSYNIMPAAAVGIYDSFKAGNVTEALSWQHKLNRYIDVMINGGYSLTAWKEVLKELDIDPGYTVAPASPITDDIYTNIVSALKEIGALENIIK